VPFFGSVFRRSPLYGPSEEVTLPKGKSGRKQLKQNKESANGAAALERNFWSSSYRHTLVAVLFI